MDKSAEDPFRNLIPVDIPEKLLKQNVTPRSLAKLHFQRKMLGIFAPVILPELMAAIRRHLHVPLPESAVMRIAGDLYGLTPKTNGGVSVLVNQQSVNAGDGKSSGSASVDKSIGSFEDIARIVQMKRKSLPAGSPRVMSPTFEFTPED